MIVKDRVIKYSNLPFALAARKALAAANIALGGNWGTSPSVGTVSGDSNRFRFTINVGSGTPGASPTATITFPKPFKVAPWAVIARNGGTAAANALTWTTTATTLVLTYNGTPGASTTIIVEGIVIG